MGPTAKEPLDLSHHYSRTTRNRLPSNIKQFYKFFQIPGIGNLAGGLPNVQYFPFDTLEAQAAKPQRWVPTPNDPEDDAATAAADKLATTRLTTTRGTDADPDTDARAASHITVPKASVQSDPLKRIDLASALQYGTAEGYPPLRSFIRQFARDCLHPNVPYAGGPEVILTCGSTDGFAKTLELLVDPWDGTVDDVGDRPGLLCEVFVYGNALAQAAPKGVQPVAVEIDSEGMMADGPGGLRDVLENWDVGRGQRPRLMYTVTMGHNPTSGVLSLQRRRDIYALCSKYDVIIVEDDPYWYLQFPSAALLEARARNLPPPQPQATSVSEGGLSSGYPFLDSLVPSYLSIDTDGRVIRLDTFSKTIAPGCRLGWITTQPALIERLMRITETSTQQPSGFVQSMVAEVLMGASQGDDPAVASLELSSARRNADALSLFRRAPKQEQARFAGWHMDGWVRWLEGLRGEYERRMNTMCAILESRSHQLKQSTPLRQSDADWGVVTKTTLYSFDWPRGGMFLWLRVHLEQHPLWQAPGHDLPVINGPVLAMALMALCTHKPYLVLAAPGLMFSADDRIRAERGWGYFRLCFAAETDANIEACSRRWADGVHRFWKIKSVDKIEELVAELGMARAEDDQAADMGDLAGKWAC